jgi:hypothetical protein
MIHEYAIPKNPEITGYKVHQIVEAITQGKSPLFVDAGDKVIIRTTEELTAEPQQPRLWNEGSVMSFQLRACVARRRKGKHIYLPRNDIDGRKTWLKEKAAAAGFEIVSVFVIPNDMKIAKKPQHFTVDATEFVGILRVVNANAFSAALVKGIGNTGRAFGLGMLVI